MIGMGIGFGLSLSSMSGAALWGHYKGYSLDNLRSNGKAVNDTEAERNLENLREKIKNLSAEFDVTIIDMRRRFVEKAIPLPEICSHCGNEDCSLLAELKEKKMTIMEEMWSLDKEESRLF